MIFSKQQQEEITVTAQPAISVEQFEDAKEWVSLSKSIGITGGEVAETELCLFLEESGISVFPNSSVFTYLSNRAERDGDTWGLFPLRDADMAKKDVIIHSGTDWPDDHGDFQEEVFRHRIPMPVLQTVKTVLDKFGNEVYFMVAAVGADPFLGVILRDSNIVFVERWEEPEFRR